MAALPKLILSVKEKSWRQVHEPGDAEFVAIRPKILERDRNKCQFCGFVSSKWQQVHHVDDDHANNRPDNLVTICVYCHMNFHIGKAGQDGALLAFVPELSAEMISHVWRTIGVAMAYPSWLKARVERGKMTGTVQLQQALVMYDAAQAALDAFRARVREAEGLLGSSDPVLLGDALLAAGRASPEFLERRGEWLRGIRLLPPGPEHDFGGADMFRHFLESGGPFAEGLSPSAWAAMLRSLDAARSSRGG